ncbi:MAG TPA: sulfatase-like hydrolase/transferase [Tepidisphaeraceae bacterium]|jgi:arylsulfatase A-like enzyme
MTRLACLIIVLCLLTPPARAAAAERPNLILILCDDLGYGDLACYGNPKIKTPNLDRLAAEGVRLTDFYCAGAQCTPSRAGLLTGRYPVRFGLTYTLMTNAGAGIPDSEILLPQVLKTAGYSTMLAGKWHLGDQPRYHPLRHGFDHFFGLLRGHDTEPRALYQDNRIIDPEADLATLTSCYTHAATAFVKQQAAAHHPFFLMLAHTSPHTPLATAPAFKGKSAGGAYGDTVEEIDDSVGQMLAALKDAGVADDTLIFFSSDNGPSIDKGKDGGSTGPLRAGKFSTFEGGVRVPAIAWMPGRIKPRVEHRPAILLDCFPTFLSIAGAKLSTGRAVDGKDLSSLLFDNKPRDGDTFFFYFQDHLQACRQGDWKLKLPDKGNDPPMLFDLKTDPGESHDLSADHADVVKDLRRRMEQFDRSIPRDR